MTKRNDVVIGLAVFCTRCMSVVRPADCDDMNGDVIVCKTCGEHSNSVVGFTVHTDSKEMLEHTHDEMRKHRNLVTELLAERSTKK